MQQTHVPCPDCGSSDAMCINDDGSTYCFSCDTFHKSADGTDTPKKENKIISSDFLKGKIQNIDDRNLISNTCQKYSYRVSTYKGRPIQIATYRDFEGTPKFQKIRFTDNKEFFIIGKAEQLLYGCNLFKGNTKKIIVTEGEIDCLSVYQVIGDYPVVSVPMGASNAIKAFKHNLRWLEQFEEVVIAFDMDEVGQKAAKECAGLLSYGKAKIMNLPLKDPNEMLKAGKIKELYKATWNAALYKPDNITDGSGMWEEINKPVQKGLSYPWQGLTDLTYGIRTSEIICIGAGTGMGKTEFFKEIEAHLILEHKQKVGIIHLEETNKETILGLMSKYSSKRFHLPDTPCTEEEKQEAYKAMILSGKVAMLDDFGAVDFQSIKETIRYMAKGLDCKYIFLDHITALADGLDKDVNQQMRNIISSLAMLTRELKITLFMISHLRKTEGKPHEEGGRVHLNDLYGAAALKQWVSFVFGLERNQQATNPEKRNQTVLRCLKDRFTGQGVGEKIFINYSPITGRLTEGAEIKEDKETKDFEESDDF